MTINLFAPALQATVGNGLDVAARPVPARSHDFGRWLLAELVAQRGAPLSWGLLRAVPDVAARSTMARKSSEPLWVDTQPWCHG